MTTPAPVFQAARRPRTPLTVDLDAGVLQAGGHRTRFDPTAEDAIELAYLKLVRRMRDVHREPSFVLRSDDVEALAAALRRDAVTVLDRLGELMGATVTQRRSMVTAFLAGAVLIAVATGAVALGAGAGTVPPPSDPVATEDPALGTADRTTEDTVDVLTGRSGTDSGGTPDDAAPVAGPGEARVAGSQNAPAGSEDAPAGSEDALAGSEDAPAGASTGPATSNTSEPRVVAAPPASGPAAAGATPTRGPRPVPEPSAPAGDDTSDADVPAGDDTSDADVSAGDDTTSEADVPAPSAPSPVLGEPDEWSWDRPEVDQPGAVIDLPPEPEVVQPGATIDLPPEPEVVQPGAISDLPGDREAGAA